MRASARSSARPMPWRAAPGRTNRSSRYRPGPADEGREVEEVQRETGGLAVPFGDQHVDHRVRRLDLAQEICRGRLGLVQQLLVVGELAHQARDDRPRRRALRVGCSACAVSLLRDEPAHRPCRVPARSARRAGPGRSRRRWRACRRGRTSAASSCTTRSVVIMVSRVLSLLVQAVTSVLRALRDVALLKLGLMNCAVVLLAVARREAGFGARQQLADAGRQRLRSRLDQRPAGAAARRRRRRRRARPSMRSSSCASTSLGMMARHCAPYCASADRDDDLHRAALLRLHALADRGTPPCRRAPRPANRTSRTSRARKRTRSDSAA